MEDKVYTQASLESETIPILKNICKEFKLPVSGKKADLIARILNREDFFRQKEEKRLKKEQETLNKIHQKNIEKARKEEEKKKEREEKKARKKEEKRRFREEEKKKQEEERARWWNEFKQRQNSYYGGAGGSYSGAGSSGSGNVPNSSSSSVADAIRFMELTPGAIGAGDVDRAFKKLSLRYHPDKGGSTEQQQKLTQCRELLKNYGYS